VKLAIIICTLRRAPSLARALESLARCHPPATADWSVVVVDNAGCAETQAAAQSFRGRLPITLLIEPTVGLAHARNAAVAATACDYFIWTDDDVTVGEDWLREYEAAIDRHPDAAFLGGPILPRFEGRPPAWIAPCLPDIYTAFAGRELSREAALFDLTSKQLPFGANLAVRAVEQRRFRYDVTLGRQPGWCILGGEELDCLKRICAAGGIGFWVPSAGVEHWIDPARQSIGYLRRFYAGVGFVQGRKSLAGNRSTHWIDALDARWQLIRSEAAYLMGRMTGRPETWIKALKHSAKLSGQIAARRAFAARTVPGSRG
jgi:glycosyltransferase involved in cell wall biosynthesis